MILVVLDGIKFKLFVMLLCHNEILLQHVSIVPCLYIFGTSHFDLYYLYSSTTACAEFEMEKREKRQREGYEALKARGEWDKLGRPVKMTQEEFLNKWDQKGKNVTDKEFAESLNISKGTLQSYKKKYLKGKK